MYTFSAESATTDVPPRWANVRVASASQIPNWATYVRGSMFRKESAAPGRVASDPIRVTHVCQHPLQLNQLTRISHCWLRAESKEAQSRAPLEIHPLARASADFRAAEYR